MTVVWAPKWAPSFRLFVYLANLAARVQFGWQKMSLGPFESLAKNGGSVPEADIHGPRKAKFEFG